MQAPSIPLCISSLIIASPENVRRPGAQNCRRLLDSPCGTQSHKRSIRMQARGPAKMSATSRIFSPNTDNQRPTLQGYWSACYCSLQLEFCIICKIMLPLELCRLQNTSSDEFERTLAVEGSICWSAAKFPLANLKPDQISRSPKNGGNEARSRLDNHCRRVWTSPTSLVDCWNGLASFASQNSMVIGPWLP